MVPSDDSALGIGYCIIKLALGRLGPITACFVENGFFAIDPLGFSTLWPIGITGQSTQRRWLLDDA